MDWVERKKRHDYFDLSAVVQEGGRNERSRCSALHCPSRQACQDLALEDEYQDDQWARHAQRRALPRVCWSYVRLIEPASLGAEPIPELEFDQTLGL